MAALENGFDPRALVRRFLQIDDTPHSIALGSSIGAFLAMTPTVGIQIIVAALVCTAVRANRVAAIILVFVSNPLTMVPIYWIDYWLGAKLMRVAMISRHDFGAIWQRIADAGVVGGIREALAVLTGEIFVPMMIGGSLIGLVVALPLYPLVYRAAVARRRRRELRRAYLRLRELRAAASESPPWGSPRTEDPAATGLVTDGVRTPSSGAPLGPERPPPRESLPDERAEEARREESVR